MSTSTLTGAGRSGRRPVDLPKAGQRPLLVRWLITLHEFRDCSEEDVNVLAVDGRCPDELEPGGRDELGRGAGFDCGRGIDFVCDKDQVGRSEFDLRKSIHFETLSNEDRDVWS
jgi:hypothetical protein